MDNKQDLIIYTLLVLINLISTIEILVMGNYIEMFKKDNSGCALYSIYD